MGRVAKSSFFPLLDSFVESMILTVRTYKITILKSARNVRLVGQTPDFGPLFQPKKVPIISQEKSFDLTTRSAIESHTCLGVGSEPPPLEFYKLSFAVHYEPNIY